MPPGRRGPRPWTGPHPPIWLGGFNDAVLKRIGEHCDGWIPVYHNDQVAFGEGSGPENVKKSRAKLHQFAEAAGREVSHFEISAILTPESAVESVQIYEDAGVDRSEEHTSELQSLMRISYGVFCLKKNTKLTIHQTYIHKSR